MILLLFGNSLMGVFICVANSGSCWLDERLFVHGIYIPFIYEQCLIAYGVFTCGSFSCDDLLLVYYLVFVYLAIMRSSGVGYLC